MKNNIALSTAVQNMNSKGYLQNRSQKEVVQELTKFQELMMVNNSAIKRIQTKLEILNDELDIKYGKSCINSIHSRLKEPLSIVKKLERKGLDFTVENISEHLADVAGVRVICNFVENIYELADMLIRQEDVTLLEMKDYIKDPKQNGYRSLHLIVEIPVYFSDNTQHVKVEIQIRTIAMDFWASLEHQLRYKNDNNNVINIDINEISRELKECSDIIAETDMRMQRVKERIDNFTI